MVENKGKEQSSKMKKLDQMMFSKHWQITLRVIGLTLGTIAIFGAIGYWLDQTLGSMPIATIAAVVISYPISQFIIYKKFTKITK